MKILIQESDFDSAQQLKEFQARNDHFGALVTFTGFVRADANEHGQVSALYLQHYPSMVEKELKKIGDEATARWNLIDYFVIHRVGTLNIGEQIVLVATLAKSRDAAFNGAAFIMDWLKTSAPFWKYEVRDGKKYWVDAKEKDAIAAKNWKITSD